MLSFLIKIYEPIIITANCNLTVLISRWYFCEPNKLSFTILGRLHNLLSFIKVQRITKLNKHFYFTGNQGNRILTCGPTAAARPSSASAGVAQRGSERAAQQGAAGTAAADRPTAARSSGSGPAVASAAGRRRAVARPSAASAGVGGQRGPARAVRACGSGLAAAAQQWAERSSKQAGPRCISMYFGLYFPT